MNRIRLAIPALVVACLWGAWAQDTLPSVPLPDRFRQFEKSSDAKLGPGDHTRTVAVGAAERRYLVYVPQKHDNGRPTAVVLAFHGGGGNPESMVRLSGLNAKAEEAGFIVVYPYGSGALKDHLLTFNGGGCCGCAMQNKIDDVGFTRALLDDLATVANVDTNRIFATGLSNGGIMAYYVASELSDRIAAIAPVSGPLMMAWHEAAGRHAWQVHQAHLGQRSNVGVFPEASHETVSRACAGTVTVKTMKTATLVITLALASSLATALAQAGEATQIGPPASGCNVELTGAFLKRVTVFRSKWQWKNMDFCRRHFPNLRRSAGSRSQNRSVHSPQGRKNHPPTAFPRCHPMR